MAQQKSKALRSAVKSVKVITATAQKVMPGRNSDPYTEYHFVVIWKEKTIPESFFWRGENGWLTCNVQRVHANGSKTPGEYIPDAADAAIHKGDTLDIRPVRGGKFAVPHNIPQGATNTLFFQTGKIGWWYYAFKNITKKPDLILP